MVVIFHDRRARASSGRITAARDIAARDIQDVLLTAGSEPTKISEGATIDGGYHEWAKPLRANAYY
jgi:hypothetical protein